MWQVREKLWQFLYLAYSQLILEAAEINTIYSFGTEADYRTPPQKQSEKVKKGIVWGANTKLIRFANWQIKMTSYYSQNKSKNIQISPLWNVDI